MPKFRKLPIEIEAMHLTRKITVRTLEGYMDAEPGDWLITGVKGEQYPCKDDIFRASYEAVDDEARAAMETA